jgi:putative FmdB family regulatory protein
MPIYEFFCEHCNTIFSFFSTRVNTTKVPTCPKCETRPLKRQLSPFARTGKAKEGDSAEDLPIDEARMARAMEALASQADKLDEKDPRQAAQLMRKLTDMTGLELSAGMQEALSRMEKGEDPEHLEEELGSMMEDEDPFVLPGKKGKGPGSSRRPPIRDETLYDL